MLGGGYVAAAITSAALGPHLAWPTVALAGALAVLYAVAYRTEFVSAAGSAVPTQPVLIALLLLVPWHVVPMAVLMGLQLAGIGAGDTGSRRDAFLVRALNGVHCLGPVAILALANVTSLSLAHVTVYLVALAAQFLVDALVAAVRASSHGVGVRQLARPLSWTFAVDGLLAVIGLCIVVAGGSSPVTVALLAAPIGLVRLLARDRDTHLQAAVSLDAAYSSVQVEARIDPLTGLANRRAWDECAESVTLLLASAPDRRVAVLAADLDGLKRVNDTAGHEAGDALIQAMAGLLRDRVPGALIVARLGGDEYGAMFLTGSDDTAAEAVVADVREAMRSHARETGQPLSASLGLACSPDDGAIEQAIRIADERAAQDKRDRRISRA